jgi:hypothetical protein
MQGQIRIIKRGAKLCRTADSTNTTTKTDRERERESVDTIKGWIAEWHERKRSLQQAADSIISSIAGRRETQTKRFSPELTS